MDLEELSRKELQQLAKDHGVRANLPTKAIITRLSEIGATPIKHLEDDEEDLHALDELGDLNEGGAVVGMMTSLITPRRKTPRRSVSSACSSNNSKRRDSTFGILFNDTEGGGLLFSEKKTRSSKKRFETHREEEHEEKLTLNNEATPATATTTTAAAAANVDIDVTMTEGEQTNITTDITTSKRRKSTRRSSILEVNNVAPLSTENVENAGGKRKRRESNDSVGSDILAEALVISAHVVTPTRTAAHDALENANGMMDIEPIDLVNPSIPSALKIIKSPVKGAVDLTTPRKRSTQNRSDPATPRSTFAQLVTPLKGQRPAKMSRPSIIENMAPLNTQPIPEIVKPKSAGFAFSAPGIVDNSHAFSSTVPSTLNIQTFAKPAAPSGFSFSAPKPVPSAGFNFINKSKSPVKSPTRSLNESKQHHVFEFKAKATPSPTRKAASSTPSGSAKKQSSSSSMPTSGLLRPGFVRRRKEANGNTGIVTAKATTAFTRLGSSLHSIATTKKYGSSNYSSSSSLFPPSTASTERSPANRMNNSNNNNSIVVNHMDISAKKPRDFKASMTVRSTTEKRGALEARVAEKRRLTIMANRNLD